ncbi:MAG: ribonuclease J [Spiroplasma sp.]|nr:ribonuclease J [Mycoplasmatales bacterium]
MKSNFKIVALGGLDENGKNAYVIETEKDMILIEAGCANFTNKSLGIDIIVPDFSYVLKHKNKLRGVLISHGHFDQMGGLRYLLDEVKVEVYGSSFTTEFLKNFVNKNDEHLLKEIKYNTPIKLGELEINVFTLSHAIFGNFGFTIANGQEAIIYATDYNFDQTTVKFARTDIKKIVDLADRYKVRALLTESIGVEHTGMAAAKQGFHSLLERYIEESNGRMIVSLYSSNLAGMTNIIRLAERYDRKIVIVGRDLLTYLNIAKGAKHIKHQRDLFIRIANLSDYQDDEIIIVVAGLYSEPYIELEKMALGKHNIVKIKQTDSVLIASKAYDEIESMAQATLDVVARTHCKIKTFNINVSSHAYQEDIKMLINLIEPEMIIPIKGEYRRQKAVQELATNIGFEMSDVHLLENGEILEVFADYAAKTTSFTPNNTLMSSKDVAKVNQIILKDREVLSDNGYVMIILSFVKNTNKIIQEPELITGGLNSFEQDLDVIEGCRKIILSEVQKDYSNRELVNKLKTKLSRYLQGAIGKTPMILPVRMEVEPKRIKETKNEDA